MFLYNRHAQDDDYYSSLHLDIHDPDPGQSGWGNLQ